MHKFLSCTVELYSFFFILVHAKNPIALNGKIANLSNVDMLWNNLLNQNIKYGSHIRIWDTTLLWVEIF